MGDFEKDLREIFEGAEFQPSEQVWEGIETSLRSGKKRIGFVIWRNYGIAAAVALFLSLGYLFRDQLFDFHTPSVEREQSLTDEVVTNISDSLGSHKKNNIPMSPDSLKPEKELVERLVVTTEKPPKGQLRGETSPKASAFSITDHEVGKGQPGNLTAEVQVRDMVHVKLIDSLRWRSLTYQMEWLAKYMIVQPKNRPYVAMKEPSQKRGIRLLSSLASGSFNPDLSVGASGDMVSFMAEGVAIDGMSASAAIVNEENEPLNSFSVGVGVGFELSRRWSLRTGLQFSQYKFSNVSNAYSEEEGSFLPIYIPAGFDNETVFFVDDYKITNTLTSITVPVVFSYRFLDFNRWGFSAKLGLGVDYFVSYQIKGDVGFLDTRKVSFADQTLFNRVNLNALTGFDVNYQLNDQLGLSGGVFFRKYMSNTQDETSGVSTNPALYGFGISVNYLIKRD